MKINIATVLIALFAFFAIASFALLGGIVRQGQALGFGAETAEITMLNDDKMRIVISNIKDFDRYRKFSSQIISGRTNILKGVADLSKALHNNIRHLSLWLFLSLSGLFVTGFALYLRLRSCMQQLARVNEEAAI